MHLLANEIYFFSILLGPVFRIITDRFFRGTESDSLNFGALSCLGHDHLPVPHIQVY